MVTVIFPEAHVAALVGIAPTFDCNIVQRGVEENDLSIWIRDSLVDR